MKYKITNTIASIVISIILVGCSTTSELVVDNSSPKSKVILQNNPDEKDFYSATSSSVSQEIYNDNVKILMLKNGENKFELDDNTKVYAVYFMLPNNDGNNELGTWKYLINSGEKTTFSISDSGNIEKN